MFGIDDFLSGLFGGAMKMFSNAQQNEYAVQNAYMQQQFTQANQREAEAFNAQQAGITRDWTAQQADIARQFSAGQQQEAEGFNASQAELNRQYQERMSSSAYQRATADMRAAGINPMLAYQQGGAASPGGSSASVGAVSGPAASAGAASIGAQAGARPGDRASLLSGVVASAAEAARLKPSVDNLKQDTQLKEEQAATTAATGAQTRAVTNRVNAETITELERAKNVAKSTEELQARIDNETGRRSRFDFNFDPFSRRVSGSLDPAYWGGKAAPEMLNSADRLLRMIGIKPYEDNSPAPQTGNSAVRERWP